MFDDDVYGETDFLALNQAAGYGLLRELDADERPHPRDVVIYEALPNELPRVAGIISTVPQTPLSHVNLRALQDGVPNAFIPDALENDDISDLIGSHVYYAVTDSGYTTRAATQAEVEAHFASSRPARTQTPQSDLTVTTITPLSDIDFDDWDAFGVRAANVAVLGTLEFPEGTVPDGFAIPFYFYDEFMKHNDLDDDIEDMLADSDFQTDYDTVASELKKLRKKIKEAEVPEWIETALTTMHGTYPDGQSLRYRSSINNEDLPNFNGAGLYDSKTQNPEETEEDGISKSLKQVYASLWNFRAFLERDFHRIDHLSTYMGALVHPNYSDDRVNGVAVSADPVAGTWSSYYVNAQVGEDLVTNPEVNSAPEELLLNPRGKYTLLALSNQVPRGDLLMTDDQMAQLRRRLDTIHDRFKELYGVRSGESFAMEIEFKVTSDNVLAIKQARPWVFPPLTGRFDLDIAAHGGSPFTVRIRFSAPTNIIRSNLRDRAVSVTGGRVTGARRTTYSPISEWWEIDVTPDSLGDVTIAVAHNRPCNNVAAICTSDGKRLSNRLERTIKGYLNNPATGLPTISGTAQVGETLTADTSGIDDGDGLSNATFAYQWIRDDGTTDSDIQDATGSTYTLTSDDEGKTITVRVTFTYDAGNAETLISQATATVATKPNNPATGVPTISGTAQVGETLTAETSGIDDDDGLSNATFAYQWIRDDGTTDSDIQDATGSTYTLTSDDGGKTIKVRVTFTDNAGNEEALTSDATAVVEAATKPNNPAIGAPTINGAAQVGETLTADTSGIDDDGLSNPTFSYQWIRSDGSTDSGIQDATGSTYTLTPDDEGKTITVRVTFTDDAGNEEALTSDATAVVAVATKPNNPAIGVPTISGAAQVGETLTADTSGIDDDDGLSNPTFSYQWTRNDGSTDSGIQDATGSTYTLTSDDEGKTIKVRVSFTDDAGNEEALTSPPLDPSRPYGLTATASGRTVVLNWKPPAVFPYLYDYQILRHRPELGETEPLVYVDTGTDETTYTDTDVEPGVLYVYRVKAANFFTRLSKASEPAEIRTPSWTPVENSPATGAPTISGAAQVGETLTADMSGIADADGLANATYSYQWLVDDIDITGATGASYTLADSDEGKAMKVRVTFTDDARNEESLTSQATAAVEARANNLTTGVPTISGTAQVGETLTADTSGIDDSDGLANTAFSFQWTRNDGSADADIQDASGSTYTLTSDDEGKTIRVRVTFTDDAGNAETLTSDATAVVAAPTRPNNPATGAPTISGTAQVGQTLTAETSGIADTDGLDNATFSLQWTRNDGSADADIQDATASTYTLTSDDDGKTIKVRVSFTDDAGNAETLTSDATSTVAAAPIPLTASVHDEPGSHDGENVFTFELRLSEEPVSTFSYGTLRDHAFTVTGGEVTKARRLEDPSNIRWEITMTPDGDGNVTVVLPVTQDCADQGAICTRDGRMLSADVTLVVTGPGDEEERNSPATGQPAISGTLQVGETLTASPSGIADADGLDNATFSYQWLADDVDISGAAGNSYTLTDSEEGKAVKVTVSFTDDAGNEESLTSVVTATVAARPLSLDDFDAGEGQTVLASALVQLGNRGRKNNGNQDRAWYASDTSAWHASGKLRDGSLAWNGMTLNRVVYFPDTGVFRFNEADDIHIGESFAAGGVNRELTVWIQTETEAVSFLVKDNIRKSGSGYISFETPTGIRPVLGGVSEGDLIIIAVSAPTNS